jgi:DNA-binding transcriptional regulator YiaG
MSSDDFADAIAELNLPKADVARLLGVDESTMRSWLNGRRSVPGTVVQMLALIEACGMSGNVALKRVS